MLSLIDVACFTSLRPWPAHDFTNPGTSSFERGRAEALDRTPAQFKVLGRSDRSQKSRQLGSGFVLGNRLQFFERAGEGVGQAPHGPGLKLVVYWLKVQLMHPSRQMLGKSCFFLNERLVDE